MSQENVEIVRRAFAHIETADLPDWDLLHEKVEINDHDLLDAGPYHGHAGYGRWLLDWLDAWSDSRMDSEEFIDAGNGRVIVLLQTTATGRASGITIERQDAMVYETQGGVVIRIDYYNNRDQALKAVGLAE